MSVKIYSGYKLPKFTVDELHSFTMSARKIISPLAIELHNKALAQIAIEMIDHQFLRKKYFNIDFQFNDKESVYNNLYYLWEAIKTKQQKGLRTPGFDFHASFTIHPLPDKILCIFYSESRELEYKFAQLNNIEYYGYWDNTDKPNEITNEQWEQREKNWEIFLNNFKAPSMNGMIAELTNDCDFKLPRYSDIAEHSQPINIRAKKYACDEIINDYIKAYKSDEKSGTNIGRLVIEAEKKSKLPEGQKLINKLAEEYSKIIPEITIDLLGKIFCERPNE